MRARVCLTFRMLTDLSQQASTKICWTHERIDLTGDEHPSQSTIGSPSARPVRPRSHWARGWSTNAGDGNPQRETAFAGGHHHDGDAPRFCPGKPWDSSMLQPERIPLASPNERRLPRHSASDHQSRSSTLRRFEIQVVRRANQARGIERVNTDPSPGPPELAVTSPP